MNQCKEKIAHFKLKYVGDYIIVTNTKLLYTQNIIDNFPKIIDFTATEKFKIHNRRLKVFKSEQKGDTISFLREIIENIRLADWQTFTEDAAACYIFMAFTKCEE